MMWSPVTFVNTLKTLVSLQGCTLICDVDLCLLMARLLPAARQHWHAQARLITQDKRSFLVAWYPFLFFWSLFPEVWAVPTLRLVSLGLIGLCTVVPLWWRRHLPGGFACAQTFGVTLGAGIWPEMVSLPYFGWLWLISAASYTVLFVGMMLWRHRQA
jgi:hypothetical protein